MNPGQVQDSLKRLALYGTFGLEVESQRVNSNGQIVKTEHPGHLGARSFHPYIQSDFAESQVELITPVCKSVERVCDWQKALHDIMHHEIKKNDEYLWPLSMPLDFSPERIQVAKLENPKDVAYRRYLITRYGKNKQMVSGIHYNFELSPLFLEEAFSMSHQDDFVSFRTEIYLDLARKFLSYQWIITYLLGATPYAPREYFEQENHKERIPKDFVRSIRTSEFGYVNHENIVVRYDSLENYVEDLEEHVGLGRLIAEKEYYANVRLRGGDTARCLLSKGIRYIECRIFDLNPYAPVGMNEKDIRFVHQFLVYLLFLNQECTQQDIIDGKRKIREVSLEHPLTPTKYQEEGLRFLEEMSLFFKDVLPKEQLDVINEKIEMMRNPSKTLAARIVQDINQDLKNIQQFGMLLAKRHQECFLEKPYQLEGFDQMELSTQLLLREAIALGIKVEILDASDQMIRLSIGDHQEVIKNGNMTSRDTTISHWVMENKVVTKELLSEKGLRVPLGSRYNTLSTALQDFQIYKSHPIVVKPKSTNYGLGISILEENEEIEEYQKALKYAFNEAQEVLIEEYVSGTEYRFFVIEDQVVAILQRDPANVVGDGVHTIEELIEIKNKDPNRGKQAPLKTIVLDEPSRLHLIEKNMTPISIPKKDEKVYLRSNSNISTGGDSIGFPLKKYINYEKVAVQAAKAMGAKICGVDIIIEDIEKEANYCIIEANYNPMMIMHAFPYEGEAAPIARNILEYLFAEYPWKQKSLTV